MYAGIDPGLSGAAAVIDMKLLRCYVYRLRLDAGRRVCAKSLHAFLARHERIIQYVTIEHLHAVFRSSASSAFSLGHSFGTCSAIASVFADLQLVTPPAWKRAYNLIKCSKKASVEKANDILYSVGLELICEKSGKKFKKHDDAEAFLIAMYPHFFRKK